MAWSAASWPGPIALVTIISRSLRGRRAWVRISAAASSSAMVVTCSTPERRSAASSTLLAAPARVLLPRPGLQRDHRPQPRRGAGGREEGARVRHGADVEQDRADAGLAGEHVEDGGGVEPALEPERRRRG